MNNRRMIKDSVVIESIIGTPAKDFCGNVLIEMRKIKDAHPEVDVEKMQVAHDEEGRLSIFFDRFETTKEKSLRESELSKLAKEMDLEC